MPVFIIEVRGVAKICEDRRRSLGEIPSGPVAFLGSSLDSLEATSSVVAGVKLKEFTSLPTFSVIASTLLLSV